jgi:hypothetical protein
MLAMDPAEHRLLGTQDLKTITFFDPDSLQEVFTLPLSPRMENAEDLALVDALGLAFSPDGRFLVAVVSISVREQPRTGKIKSEFAQLLVFDVQTETVQVQAAEAQ